ncbi:MAG TPA: Flp family type IVb pilin [Pseudolabrys sp.]|nr:Flp family type IVb pilin [Pseudolabrys sp.]
MRKLAQRFLEDNSGAAAIEYGLIAAGISFAIIISLVIIVTASTIDTQLIAPSSNWMHPLISS